MSDLRGRIGAVQLAHMPDDYQRDMGECPCGFKYQKWSELASHVADAVIRELGLKRFAYRGDKDSIAHYQYITGWIPDDNG